MPSRRAFLFAAAGYSLVMSCSVAVPAAAGDAAATAFVTQIYDAYKGKNSKGVSIDSEAKLRRWFEPSLATLIIKDQKAAARRKDVPTLDGDPFIDAQDWEISSFDIAVADVAPGQAVATVSFKNIDQPKKILLNLVKIKNDWRITDIVTERDGKTESLRGLFKH